MKGNIHPFTLVGGLISMDLVGPTVFLFNINLESTFLLER